MDLDLSGGVLKLPLSVMGGMPDQVSPDSCKEDSEGTYQQEPAAANTHAVPLSLSPARQNREREGLGSIAHTVPRALRRQSTISTVTATPRWS